MSREQEVKTHQPRRRGPMGHGMQPGEKPKDFKKSIKKLMSYIGKYKAAIFVVMFFAACSTIFNVAGPKILGKATTALSEGLMAKIQGTGSIDFGKIGSILLFVLGLYLCSAVFNFIQGWIMTGITQKVCYQLRKEISEKIDSKKDYYAEISNKIWEFAEPRFQEYRSSELLQHVLKQAGFSIKADLAGEKTAFIAEYGSGKPVIAFLGEFDALPGLSQKADAAERIPANTGSCGHGCGHQLIGTGTLASAIALKDFVKEHNLQGTIRYYGCPAEENAGGKAFLVRDGYFNDCDLALCWHPEQGRRACYGSTKANFRVFFTFHGTPAHASMCPELGRSALDAVELMDVGVNYMREHMIDEARIHYAITDTGGDAPNVVQSRAQVLYAIRAPKITQVKELYNRVCNIARGAALMTETTVEIRQVAAYSNLISSKILADHMNAYLEKLGPITYTEEEYAYAQKFQQSLSDQDKNQLPTIARDYFGPKAAEVMKKPIFEPMAYQNLYSDLKYSTDVGDVSWLVPTVHLNIPTFAAGTALHSWQAAAQGKSSIAHKGMLYAAKIMALTAIDFLQKPELVNKAREELTKTLNGETYPNPLPKDLKPEIW